MLTLIIASCAFVCTIVFTNDDKNNIKDISELRHYIATHQEKSFYTPRMLLAELELMQNQS